MKGQSSIEAMGAIVFITFTAILFFGAISDRIFETTKEQEKVAMEGLLDRVKNEIDLAISANNGYYRVFEIPQRSGGFDFTIELRNDDSGFQNITAILINSTSNDPVFVSYYYRQTAGQIIGNFTKGMVPITKQNNIVYVNATP